MLYCSHCASQFQTVSYLMRHIRRIHSTDPGIHFHCNLQGCKRTFQSFKVYRNHVYTFHSTGSLLQAEEIDSSGTGEDETQLDTGDGESDDSQSDMLSGAQRMEETTPAKSLRQSVALSILKIREVHRIPLSVMDNILAENQSIFSLAIGAISDRVRQELSDAGVSQDVSSSVLRHLSEASPLTQLFNGLETENRRSEFYRENFRLLDPVKVVLGTKLKAQGYGSKRRLVEKEEIMVYVPILKTLEVLLNDSAILAEVESGHVTTTPDVVRDYCDGSECKTHPLFSLRANGLQIMLYYDDVELCNPLGSSRTKHKVGFFYFSLGNLHPRYRSRINTIQLVAICKHRFIKKYSLSSVLAPLVKDLKMLENGYKFLLGGISHMYYGALALVSADNPASSAIGGFKEGSSALRPCRQCLGSKLDTQQKFKEEDFELRALDKHKEQVDEVEGDSSGESSKEFGINSRSALLDLQYFDLCSGTLLPDIMHDVLEGALQYEMKLLLKYCILEQKYFRLDTLNVIIEQMELGYMESDRPATISSKTLSSTDNALKQKAMQSWLLCRLAPFMIGKFIPEDDSHWSNYLLMIEIADFLFAPEISTEEVGYLKVQIEEHHSAFCLLYPSASIIPKMHYLIHTPRLITKFGPLVRHWTMRYEAKHSYFKKLAQNIGNFKNIAWTLAKRHQFLQCYHTHSVDYIGQERYEVGPGSVVSLMSRPPELRDDDCSCYRSNWIKFDGVLYKKPSAILAGVEEDLPVFAEVVDVFVYSNKPILYTRLFQTEHYNHHYHCFVLKAKPLYKVVDIESIRQPTVYHIRKLPSDTSAYAIVPKFFVCGTVRV